MLITKDVEVGWNPQNRQHFESLGYKYEWRGKFIIPVEHLPRNSHVKVQTICDYCGKEMIPITWQRYQNTKTQIITKDCCVECRPVKQKEFNMLLYGVENQFQRKEIQDKAKLTNFEKYGVEYYQQTDEYQERRIKTCLDKYGYDNVGKVPEFIEKVRSSHIEKYGMMYTQTDECKEKIQNTCMELYGVENVFQSEEIKEKIQNTCLEKYGFKNSMQNKNIKLKTVKTLSQNGKIFSSKQQNYLHKLLGGIKNYIDDSTGVYPLDIAFPENKIYIEYNGGGHNMMVKTGKMSEGQFLRREMDRYYFLKRNGWKQIKIISPRDYLPSDEVIIEEFNKAIVWLDKNEKYHNHYNINIGIFANDPTYGQLRFIK